MKDVIQPGESQRLASLDHPPTSPVLFYTNRAPGGTTVFSSDSPLLTERALCPAGSLQTYTTDHRAGTKGNADKRHTNLGFRDYPSKKHCLSAFGGGVGLMTSSRPPAWRRAASARARTHMASSWFLCNLFCSPASLLSSTDHCFTRSSLFFVSWA